MEVLRPIERVAEVGLRFGRFLFTTPNVHPFMSTHYHPNTGAAPMLDGHLDKARIAAHYVAIAEALRAEVVPGSVDNYHQVFIGDYMGQTEVADSVYSQL